MGAPEDRDARPARTLSRLLWVGLLGVACFGLTGPFAGLAAAQTGSEHRRTVVLRLDYEGDVSAVGRERLSGRLFEALAATGFRVFAADDVTANLYSGSPELRTCDNPDCFKRIAGALGAHFLVLGAVDVDQRNYDISLRVIFGRTGEQVAGAKERCEICGIREASETLAVAASGLRTGIEKVEAPGELTVDSSPPGALIVLDGQTVGFTPATIEVPAGIHTVRLSADGYDSESGTIEVKAGDTQTLSASLKVRPTPLVGTGWTVTGWSAVGAGVLALAAGAFLINEHASLADCNRDTCDELQSKWPGAALAAAGGLLVGGGSVLIYLNAATTPAQSATTDVATGWQMGVQGRF